jgi:hypothetical protein
MSILGEFAQVSIAALVWLLWFRILSQVCLFKAPSERLLARLSTGNDLDGIVVVALAYVIAIAARHYGGYAFRHIRNHYTGWYVFAPYVQPKRPNETPKQPNEEPWFRQWSDPDLVEALSKAYGEPWPDFEDDLPQYGNATARYRGFIAGLHGCSRRKRAGRHLNTKAREVYNRARDLMLDKAGADLAGHFSYHYHVKRVAQHGTLPLALSFCSLWLLMPPMMGWPTLVQAGCVLLSAVIGWFIWRVTWVVVFRCDAPWTDVPECQATKQASDCTSLFCVFYGQILHECREDWPECSLFKWSRGRCQDLRKYLTDRETRPWGGTGIGLSLALLGFATAKSICDMDGTCFAVFGVGLPCLLVGGVLVYLAAMEARERYKWMIDIVARFVIQRDNNPTPDS